MLKLHPEILVKDGKKQFAVLPYEEFLAVQERLADAEDLFELRDAKSPHWTGARRRANWPAKCGRNVAVHAKKFWRGAQARVNFNTDNWHPVFLKPPRPIRLPIRC